MCMHACLWLRHVLVYIYLDLPYSDINECSSNTNGCDHVCTNTEGSFQCSCNDGYTLSTNGRSCLVIDECSAGTHNCQQLCINTNGGFVCNCNSGYQLTSDGYSCFGELSLYILYTYIIIIDSCHHAYKPLNS